MSKGHTATTTQRCFTRVALLLLLALLLAPGVGWGQKTYYSYKIGDWNAASTWTLDPTGTTAIGAAIPTASDYVVVRNGDYVTFSTGNAINVKGVEVESGATLDLGNTSGHTLGDVNGKGLLRISSTTLPSFGAGNFNSAGGGTVEIYSSSNITLSAAATFNNLILNMGTVATYFQVQQNLTLNGNLEIRTGELQVAGSGLTLTFNGNTTIGANGKLMWNSGGGHKLLVYGDFINNGTAQFSNLTTPDYTNSNNKNIEVTFANATKDQLLQCNGPTLFYKLIVDKGSDDTYMLDVQANNTANFQLLGRNDDGWILFSGYYYNDNLLLLNGTLKLGRNIAIPNLITDKLPISPGTFNIPSSAKLWIDGADVALSNNLTKTMIAISGKLTISNGDSYLHNIGGQGLVLRNGGVYEQSNGRVEAPIFRTSAESSAGDKLGSFIMSGGTLTLTGSSQVGSHATFSLPYSANVFNMSGGILDIQSPTTATGSGNLFGMLLGMNLFNSTVTGGTVKLGTTTNNTYLLTTVSLPNLEVYGGKSSVLTKYAGNTGGSFLGLWQEADIPTIQLNKLTVLNNCLLNGSNLDASNQDVEVGGNFTISAGATYTPGTNTTRFNGAKPQAYSNSGTANLNNVELAQSNTYVTLSSNMAIGGNLTIGANTTLYDQGFVALVDNNITNSGTHTSSGNGSISLRGSGKTIGGSGVGVFGTLLLSGGGTTTLTANQRIDGATSALRLVNGLLDIGSYRLTLGPRAGVFSDAATGTSFLSTKMIKTSGLISDEGMVKDYSGGSYTYPYTFTFPVGFGNSYRPAALTLNVAPTQLGQVTLKPVNGEHPLVATTNSSLACYWKTSNAGFAGLNASWAFQYVQNTDVKPNAGSETNYKGRIFRNSKWLTGAPDVGINAAFDQVVSTNQSAIDGEYTAGLDAAFSAPNIFYSISSTGWDIPSTWSSTPGGAAGTTTPDANSIVVIGEGLNGSSSPHEVVVPADLQSAACKRLTIKSGSTLDVKIPTKSSPTRSFGYLSDQSQGGGGTLKVELGNTTALPSGDLSDFCGSNGGTVEYYGAVPRILPAAASYYNLKLSPTGVAYTLPTGKITVYNDLTLTGSTTTTSSAATGASATNLSVGGNLNLTQGAFKVATAGPHAITVGKNVTISSSASFNVTGGTNHAITVYGDILANGAFNTSSSTLLLTGATLNNLSGVGNVTINNLTVDKGASQATGVNISNATTKVNGSTTLLNGSLNIVGDAALNINGSSSSFTIPSTAALSVSSANAEVVVNSSSTSNDGDVLLFGKLEVQKGRMLIGPKNTSYNNDIEIGASGSPTLKIGGGNLYVGGQIRRNVGQLVGALRYYQDSGSVYIRGIAQTGVPNTSLPQFKNNQRAKLEILNPGSVFSMSGGTLKVLEDAGANFGDLYLDPESSNVSGGVVEIGYSGSNNKTYNLASSCLLPSVVVTSGNTANVKIYPLQTLYDLTIASSATFNANGLDVSIGRSLFNYQPNTGFNHGAASGSTQTTTFYSSVAGQLVGTSGSSTKFSTLIISKPNSSLTLGANSNITVEKLLDLSNGTLIDGGSTVTVQGDMKNTSAHVSDKGNSSGGISFNSGTANVAQRVWSDVKGTFGNVEIKNAKGVLFDDEFYVNGRLALTNGILNIDENLLHLGVNTDITGTLGSTKYIMTNGIYRDKGVEKTFPKSASAVIFIYPLGVAGGKYTPATITLSNNMVDGGSVRILPINSEHPMLVDPSANKPNLDYYWIVEPSANLSGYTSTMSFTYTSTFTWDSNSKVGRFLDDNWNPLGGISDAAINTGAKTFTISNKNYLKGEYTIANTLNLYGKPIYYSNANGYWENGTTWLVKKPEDPDVPASYSVPASGPHGHRVVIKPAHTVTITSDSRQAYSVQLDGALNLQDKIYHDFRRLTGSGTLMIAAYNGQFLPPGGDLSVFTNQAVSTIQLSGAGTIDARFMEFPNLTFVGVGEKVIPISLNSKYHTVYGNLLISGGSVKKLGSLNQGILRVYGNWTNNVGSTGWVPGFSQVQLLGSAAQTVSSTATEQFYNLLLQKNDKSQKVAFASFVDITSTLSLNRGIVEVATGKVLRLTSTGIGYTRNGFALSDAFVDGALQKSILTGGSFIFPVGDMDQSAPIGALNTSTSATPSYWEAQYYKVDPNTDKGSAYDNTQLSGISNKEYWRVKNTSSGAADKSVVRLYWSTFSGMPTSSSDQNKIREAEWNGTKWMSVSAASNVDKVNQTVQSSTQLVNSNTDKFYTLSFAGMPTAVLSTPSPVEICRGETTNITANLSGTAPWTIKYSIDGGAAITLNPIATPFTFALSGSDLGGAIDKDLAHKVKVVYVKDASGSENLITSNEVAVTVKRSPNPVIVGQSPSMQGATGVVYSVTSVTGDSYSWVVSGGTIKTGQGTNQITVDWGNTSSGTVTVLQTPPARTLPSTNCPVQATISVSLNAQPTPSITGSSETCVNTMVTYSTPNNTGNSYAWSFPGAVLNTDYTVVATSNTAQVTWKTSGNRQVQVKETKGGASGTATLDVLVNGYPATDKVISDATVCRGSAAAITIGNSELGAYYQLYDGANTPVGGAVNGDGSTITLLPIINVAKGSYVNYTVRSNIGVCQSTQVDKPKIDVLEIIPGIESNLASPICNGEKVVITAKDDGAIPAQVSFYLNGSKVTNGVVGNTFTSTTLANNDEIYAVIGNGTCTANTAKLVFGVNQCQPLQPEAPTTASATICKGIAQTAVSITTDPTGADPNSYIWYINGVQNAVGVGSIAGATKSATITWDANFSGTAQITVVANNSYGASVASNLLTITVVGINPGTISSDKDNPYCFKQGDVVNININTDATVTPVSSITYTWELLTDKSVPPTYSTITGATSKSYSVTSMDEGVNMYLKMQVRRRATSGSCSAISNDITINRMPITGPPYHVGNNVAK